MVIVLVGNLEKGKTEMGRAFRGTLFVFSQVGKMWKDFCRMCITFPMAGNVETVENHGCGKGQNVSKNVETMPNGNLDHAWSVQYVEK